MTENEFRNSKISEKAQYYLGIPGLATCYFDDYMQTSDLYAIYEVVRNATTSIDKRNTSEVSNDENTDSMTKHITNY